MKQCGHRFFLLIILLFFIACDSTQKKPPIGADADSEGEGIEQSEMTDGDFLEAEQQESEPDALEEEEAELDIEQEEAVIEDFDEDGLPDEEEEALGCDKALKDTDKDGVSDGEEVALGFDCADALNAPEWEPGLEWAGVHPHLAAFAEDRERLRGYLETDEAFQAILTRVQNSANRDEPTSEETEYDPYLAYDQAVLAKNAAFLHWLGVEAVEGEKSYAEKAKRMLFAFDTDLSDVDLLSRYLDKITIHTSEAMIYFAHAFDFLAATDALSDEEYALLRARLIELGRQFFDAYFVRMDFTLRLFQNNHTIKAATGIGIIGLLFPDAPEARVFVSQALSTINFYHLNHQICEGGANAEGPAYFEYTMINLRGFGLALHRIANGESLQVYRQCRSAFDECENEWVDIPDILFDEAHLRLVSEWMKGLWLPTGYVANFDDSDLVKYNWGFDAFLYGSPQALWLWENAASTRKTSPSDAVETACLYDPSLTPEKPDFSTKGYAGYVRLVSGEGENPDEMTALLVGEKGCARKHGVGHEQPDNQSFILNWKKAMWIIDSGYLHYSERDLVAHDINHNVILVDGKGGPMSMVDIYNTDDDAEITMPNEPPVKQAGVSLIRKQVRITRTLAFLDDTLALVVDRMQPEDDGRHEYSLLFHTNGGGTTDGETTIQDGRSVMVIRDGLRLAIHPQAHPLLQGVMKKELPHSFHRREEAHDRIRIDIGPTEAGRSVQFCTAFRFSQANDSDPNLTYRIEHSGEIVDSDWCWAATKTAQGNDENLYLWRHEPNGEACFKLSRLQDEDSPIPLGEIATSASLTRVTIPAVGEIRAESVGEGTVRWISQGQLR